MTGTKRPAPAAPRATRRSSRQERGAATLLVLAFAVAVLVCTCGAVAAGRLLTDHRRAAAAADLAALAGAAAVQRGTNGCVAARQVAAANDATVVTCKVGGDEVRLAVRTDSVRLLGRDVRLQARARAGPVR